MRKSGSARTRKTAAGKVVCRDAALLVKGLPFGWPELLRMKLAASYAGSHPITLKRAVRYGKLKVAGRCGRSWTFKRADLDAWLLGKEIL